MDRHGTPKIARKLAPPVESSTVDFAKTSSAREETWNLFCNMSLAMTGSTHIIRDDSRRKILSLIKVGSVLMAYGVTY